MIKGKVSTIEIVLISTAIVAVLISGILFIKSRIIRSESHSLAVGDTIPQLELITIDNEPFDQSIFEKGFVLVFCFEVPCAKCNKNLNYWINLAQYFNGRIKTVGIIPDGDPEAFRLMEDRKINFPLYLPSDQNSLRKRMRLKTRRAQTIVVFNKKIKAVKVGILTLDDLKFLRTIIGEFI
jgi:peroxiredoxin